MVAVAGEGLDRWHDLDLTRAGFDVEIAEFARRDQRSALKG